ncbi:MAG: OmpA family protein [Pseudomonadota bacterium]
MTNTLTFRTALGIAVAVSATTTAAANCAAYDGFTKAVEKNDFATAEILFETLELDPACGDDLRSWGASYLARETFISAVRDTTDPAKSEKLLNKALGYEEHWRTYSELGRLAGDNEDFAKAALYYQKAINRLAEGPKEHKATEAEIEEVYRLATASVGLAGEVVELPKMRSGAPGGIFAGTIRGFVVEEVSLPITYQFNKTEFDDQGEAFAGVLADHLKDVGASKVVLSGHTDPKGDEDYNLRLSVDRAEALGKYLEASGFDGTIEVLGFGETQPPVNVLNLDPDSDEYHRLSRRVVFSLG